MSSQLGETQVGRPGFGKAGRIIKVSVNAFQVSVPKSLLVHHYDLSTKPGDLPPIVGRELFRFLVQKLNAFEGIPAVYDGRANVYSPKKLPYPQDEKVFEVDLPEQEGGPPPTGPAAKRRHFSVQIKKVSQVDLNALTRHINQTDAGPAGEHALLAINALNVLCNHDVNNKHPSKRNTFYPIPRGPADMIQLARGIELWRGYFSSIRPSPNGLIFNFDITSHPFIKSGNLIQVAMAITGAPNENALASLPPAQRVNLERGLRMVTVEVKLTGGRTYMKKKALGISPQGANALKFQNDQGKSVTVADYFRTAHNVTLRYPQLPCVRLSKKAYYPLEVCNVPPGQKFSRRLDPDQLADAIKWLTVKPGPRQDLLLDGLKRNFHPENTPSLRGWDVKFQPKPMQIAARILAPPKLVLKSTRGKPADVPFQPVDGAWDMRQKHVFQKGKAVPNWMVIVFSRQGGFFNDQHLDVSLKCFVQGMVNSGIDIAPTPSVIEWAGRTRGDLRNVPLEQYIRNLVGNAGKGRPGLIVCYFDDKNAWQYPELKRFGDLQTGVATQGLNIAKAKVKDPQRGSPQYYGNVALKVNVKLGGLNHVINPIELSGVFKEPTMVLGADVTHPSPESNSPSIAGVVASMNKYGTGYIPDFRVQAARQEIIVELDQMVETLVKRFRDSMAAKILPKNLIFYRDGVSSGQFQAVLDEEIPLVRLGCRRVDPKWNPKLTFVICGKRHHMKFGPLNPQDTDRSGNLKPGAIVDTDVISPFDFDWYGQSHAGLLGTSRSSHYTVLVDDSHLSADDLQKLTYYLCYLYSRATRSVSICTPAYHAHHVCTRAKLWLTGMVDDAATIVTGSSQAKKEAEEAALTAYRDRATSMMATKQPWMTEFWM